ncbi:hypothetical protein EDD85DRAFT_783835 [Armillaria nabsnona]|nr:hypothetical protein EDD85DRAFT_783835 [Armillaria nabsnona]
MSRLLGMPAAIFYHDIGIFLCLFCERYLCLHITTLTIHYSPMKMGKSFDLKVTYVPKVLSDEDAKKKSALREKTNELVEIMKPPKAQQAYQEWMDEAIMNGATGRPMAEIHMGTAWDLFAELTEVEQAEWKDRAKETAEANKRKYQNALKAPPLKDPKECQFKGDWKATALPSLGDDVPLIQDEGLYTLEEDFPGLMENLDDISDSSDDDISSSDDEAPRKKRKRGPKPSDGNQKKRAVIKDDDAPAKTKVNDSNKENNSSTSMGSTKGKQCLSAYELQRLENIENIQNNPWMKELNEEIRQLQEERHAPRPKPRPRAKKMPEALSRRSGCLQTGEAQSIDEVMLKPCYQGTLIPLQKDSNTPVNMTGSLNIDSAHGDIDMEINPEHANAIKRNEFNITVSSSVSGSVDPTNSHDRPAKVAEVPIQSTAAHNPSIFKDDNVAMEPLLPEKTPMSLTANVTPKPDLQWFMLPYNVFVAGGLGPTYSELLTTFATLEKTLSFQQVCIGFQAKGRLKLLSFWVGWKCMKCEMPVLKMEDIPEFHDTWWAWWRSLQPEWRKPGSVSCMQQDLYSDKWTSLNISGPDSWLGIVATLFW